MAGADPAADRPRRAPRIARPSRVLDQLERSGRQRAVVAAEQATGVDSETTPAHRAPARGEPWLAITPAVAGVLRGCLGRLRAGAGLTAVIGEPGMGKTAIANLLVRGLRDFGHRARLLTLSSTLTSFDFWALVAHELRLGGTQGLGTRAGVLHAVRQRLQTSARFGGRGMLLALDNVEALGPLPEVLQDFAYVLADPRGRTRAESGRGLVCIFGTPPVGAALARLLSPLDERARPLVLPPLDDADCRQFAREFAAWRGLPGGWLSEAALECLPQCAAGNAGRLRALLEALAVRAREDAEGAAEVRPLTRAAVESACAALAPRLGTVQTEEHAGAPLTASASEASFAAVSSSPPPPIPRKKRKQAAPAKRKKPSA